MMQNFYNKASAHNSVQQLPKTDQNPKPKSNSKTTETPTKEKNKNFETNYKINILSKQFPFCEKERKREREKGNVISYVQNGVFFVFWAVQGLACFNN
jgi:hypothetical protein